MALLTDSGLQTTSSFDSLRLFGRYSTQPLSLPSSCLSIRPCRKGLQPIHDSRGETSLGSVGEHKWSIRLELLKLFYGRDLLVDEVSSDHPPSPALSSASHDSLDIPPVTLSTNSSSLVDLKSFEPISQLVSVDPLMVLPCEAYYVVSQQVPLSADIDGLLTLSTLSTFTQEHSPNSTPASSPTSFLDLSRTCQPKIVQFPQLEVFEDHFPEMSSQVPCLHPSNGRWHCQKTLEAVIFLHSTGGSLIFPKDRSYAGSFVTFLRNQMTVHHNITGTFSCRGIQPHVRTDCSTVSCSNAATACHRQSTSVEYAHFQPAVATAMRRAVNPRSYRCANEVIRKGGMKKFGSFCARTLTHFVSGWGCDGRKESSHDENIDGIHPEIPCPDVFVPQSSSDERRKCKTPRDGGYDWDGSEQLPHLEPVARTSPKSSFPHPSSISTTYQTGCAPPSLVQLQHELWGFRGGLYLFGDGYLFIGTEFATLVIHTSVSLLRRSDALRMVREACVWKLNPVHRRHQWHRDWGLVRMAPPVIDHAEDTDSTSQRGSVSTGADDGTTTSDTGNNSSSDDVLSGMDLIAVKRVTWAALPNLPRRESQVSRGRLRRCRRTSDD